MISLSFHKLLRALIERLSSIIALNVIQLPDSGHKPRRDGWPQRFLIYPRRVGKWSGAPVIALVTEYSAQMFRDCATQDDPFKAFLSYRQER